MFASLLNIDVAALARAAGAGCWAGAHLCRQHPFPPSAAAYALEAVANAAASAFDRALSVADTVAQQAKALNVGGLLQQAQQAGSARGGGRGGRAAADRGGPGPAWLQGVVQWLVVPITHCSEKQQLAC